MTPEGLQLLTFIRGRIERTGVAPSYREMMSELGMRSNSGVFLMVARLVEAGHLVRVPGRHRGLRLPGVDLRSVPTHRLRAELARREAA
ncbi:MAG TPA: hypothetical protein VEC11_07650 [Allosphingosinicella sp.]|nr:hypothetical protein [Allosphingosinicella sp.]